MSNNSYCCEFSISVAEKFGLDLAVLHGFFYCNAYLTELQDGTPSYPTVEQCVAVLKFWDEKKIRKLISELYLNKLI